MHIDMELNALAQQQLEVRLADKPWQFRGWKLLTAHPSSWIEDEANIHIYVPVHATNVNM